MRGKSYLYYGNYLTFDSSIWIRKVIFGKIWIKSWYAHWNQNDKQWRLPSWISLFCRHIEPRYKFISRHRFAFLLGRTNKLPKRQRSRWAVFIFALFQLQIFIPILSLRITVVSLTGRFAYCLLAYVYSRFAYVQHVSSLTS